MNKKVNLETKVMNSESMKIGNVLSLFDGMSCGQIALNRAGIAYDKYFEKG